MNTAFVTATPAVTFRAASSSFVSNKIVAKPVVRAAPARKAANVVRMDTELPKVPQGFTAFSEQLNGRVAMMGLLLGFVTEVITGRGIVGQLSSIFEIWSLASTLGN